MSRRRRRRQLPSEPVEVEIESLSHDGRGVTHVDGKTVFVHGGLPGERVQFLYTKRQRRHDEGKVMTVLQASAERAEPPCEYFDLCGGCSLQHQRSDAQLAAKQQAMLETLQRIGKVQPEQRFAPLTTERALGYRRKARLGVKYVQQKGKVLVGFRERGTSFVADIDRCRILHPKVGELLKPLSELIGGLSIRERVPQIEVAMGDSDCILIVRVLDEPTDDDRAALLAFAAEHDLHIHLQPGGPDTVTPLGDAPTRLHYALPAYDLQLAFLPNDFTQVNSDINRQMIERALDLLDPQPDERVLDLFCGLGNFTLPLARRAGQVVGVEGDSGLVQRGRDNARANGIDNAEFFVANLYEDLENPPWVHQPFDKVLLDPPRSGAQPILSLLPRLGAQRIVYVSCYPGTLARDAGELVEQHGYQLLGAGVMDMFPHTGHVESIALFEKRK